MLDRNGNPIKAHESDSEWIRSFDVSDIKCLVVCRGPVRKEAFDHSGLIYGIGHAVYTLSDPRAVILKRKADELAREKGLEKEFALYAAIERIAPDVIRRVKRSNIIAAANVDFYSGFVYTMLNIPQDLFTPIFAIARIAGWCAHRIEEQISGGRIIRPAYKNVLGKRNYVPMRKRG